MITQYDKAIVAFLVPTVIVGLSHFGLLPQMSVQDAVTMLVGAFVGSVGVFATKNK